MNRLFIIDSNWTGEVWDSTGWGTWVYDSNSRVAITASLTVFGLHWHTASDISGCCSCLKKRNNANCSFASSLHSGYALSARKHKSSPKSAQFSSSLFFGSLVVPCKDPSCLLARIVLLMQLALNHKSSGSHDWIDFKPHEPFRRCKLLVTTLFDHHSTH